MRVLVADDDREMAEALAAFVRECGFDVVGTVTGGGLAVIQAFARLQPEIVLLDIAMPRYNGLTVCHALLSRRPDTKVIFISAREEGNDMLVRLCGAAAYLQKPVCFTELRQTLAEVGRPLALA